MSAIYFFVVVYVLGEGHRLDKQCILKLGTFFGTPGLGRYCVSRLPNSQIWYRHSPRLEYIILKELLSIVIITYFGLRTLFLWNSLRCDLTVLDLMEFVVHRGHEYGL